MVGMSLLKIARRRVLEMQIELQQQTAPPPPPKREFSSFATPLPLASSQRRKSYDWTNELSDRLGALKKDREKGTGGYSADEKQGGIEVGGKGGDKLDTIDRFTMVRSRIV